MTGKFLLVTIALAMIVPANLCVPFEWLSRERRQITTVPQEQYLAQPQQAGNNVLSFLTEQLAPGVAGAQNSVKMLSSLFSPQQQQQQQPGSGPQPVAMALQAVSDLQQQGQQVQQPALSQASQLMSQLTSLVKSGQDNSARLASQTSQSVQGANQATLDAAKSAQGGITSALTEIGQGLQRIATNNPSLLPDVKSLYQSVSSKLSSASSSVQQAAGQQPAMSSSIQPATNSEQLADNLAKLAVPGLQTPA